MTATVDAPPRIAVHRHRLDKWRDLAFQQRLTIVVAPPGYGKTVLLAQWAASPRPGRVRWLTLGPEHNDPIRFAWDVCRVLQTPGLPVDVLPLARAGVADHSVAPAFIAAVSQQLQGTPPTTLVLDDFHRLSCDALLDPGAALIEHAPPSLHIVLASRIDPSLRFFRFRLRDALVELRQEDLAFTTDEAAELIRLVSGRDLPASDIYALVARTEGWAAGLQLAALSLREQADVGRFIARFAGDDRHIADYLTEQVLARQSEHVRRFLLSSSVLDRMSGPLCDFVIGCSRSQAMLEDLDRRSMFIRSLDAGHNWFRYHRLFRTLLRHYLRAEDPSLEDALLRRAAEWHLARLELDTAVNYFAEAGLWEEMLDVVSKYSTALLRRGRSGEVASWIRRVPASLKEGRVPVLLLEAAANVMEGDPTRAGNALATIDQIVDLAPTDRVVAEVIRSIRALIEGDQVGASGAADRVLENLVQVDEGELPPTFGLARSRADLRAAGLVTRGVSRLLQGQLADARQDLSAVPDDAHGAWRACALGVLALIEAWTGHYTAAEQLSATSLCMTDELELGLGPSAGARLAMAMVARGRDQLDRAGALLESLTGPLDRLSNRAIAAYIATEQAHVALARGEPTTALAVLANDRAAEHASMARPLRTSRCVVEAQLSVAIADLAGAQRVLDLAPEQDSSDVRATRVLVAVERGDIEAARALIAQWPIDPMPRARLQRKLWLAIIDHLEGDAARACSGLATVVAEAELEGNVGLFRDAGPHVLGLARALYRVAPSAFIRRIVAYPLPPGRTKAAKQLVEQLTEREYLVLSLLPTRMSNMDIANRLGVSLNTIKTHLKHIYRKFGVAGRSEAVDAAERLHLL
jgi:LuxR family maltose regulon positive regulatory protein